MARQKDILNPPRSSAGRPGILDKIAIDELIELMLKYARGGKFLYEMPGIIWIEKGIQTSHDALDRIEDERFRVARNIAKSLCISYWTERMGDASAPTNAWIFIMKNIASWSDKKDVTVTGSIDTSSTKAADEASLNRLKNMIAESGKGNDK